MYEQKLTTAKANSAIEIEGLQHKLKSFQDGSRGEKAELAEKVADLESQNKKLEEQVQWRSFSFCLT